MKKILVTGASGFLGSRIVRTFIERYEILAPTHSELDITDDCQVNQYLAYYRPDRVIHCAAISDVGRCEREPELSWRINVDGSINLAKASCAIGAKYLLCSSDQVYFGSKEDGPHREDEILIPCNLYGREKLKAEEACLKHNPDCICLRLSWMYDVTSENGREHGDFFRTLLPKLMAGETVSYPVHDIRGITDVNEVICNLEKTFEIPGGIYNFGSPNGESTYEMLYKVFRTAGVNLSLLQKNEEAFRINPRNISMCQKKLDAAGIEFRSTADGIAENLKRMLR